MSVVSKKFSASLYSMLVLLLLCIVTAFSSGCGSKASLDPAKPVTLTIWHVYGNQTNSPFNDTIENSMPLRVRPKASLSRLLP